MSRGRLMNNRQTRLAGWQRCARTCDQGFTLLEIMIALFIFTIVSLLLVAALRSVMNTDAGVERNADRLHAMQMTLLLLSRDIEQTVNRPILGNTGREEAAFIGEQHVFSFTHGGLADPGHKLVRSSLQRVTYHWHDNAIVRATWPTLDLAPGAKAKERVLMTDVANVRFEYLDSKGKLQRAWPSKENNSQPEALPRAVAMTITINNWGTLKQFYVIPAQASTVKVLPPAAKQS